MYKPVVIMLLANPFRPDSRALKEAEGLSRAGYSIIILAWDRRAEFPSEERVSTNIHVIRIQNVLSAYGIGIRQFSRLPLFWRAAWQYLNNLHPELLHCHDFDTLGLGLLYGWRHGVPVIFDAREYYAELVKPRLSGIHGQLLYWIIKIAERWGARRSAAIITVDETLGKIYRQLNSHVIIVGHHPDIERFSKAADVFSSAQLTMIYVGRLSTDRGLLIYIEILRELLRLGVPAKLLLAGTFTPESERQAFEACIRGIEEFVDYRGWVSYDLIPEILASADVGLVILAPEPRYIAALPVKLLEYMAAGLPVIACNYAYTASIVKAADCGALITPDTVPALIAKLIQDWWVHPDIPRNFGKNGRREILQNNPWSKNLAQVVELYQNLLTK
jgi:glycosyltransferase involved in cell wall biosynthesis